MSDLKNKYYKIIEKEAEQEYELFNPLARDDEYWTIDHVVMGYFEEIEEIPKPKHISDINRLFEGFQYHSQYLEYKIEITNLIGQELKEYLHELFSILSRANSKALASQRRCTH